MGKLGAGYLWRAFPCHFLRVAWRGHVRSTEATMTHPTPTPYVPSSSSTFGATNAGGQPEPPSLEETADGSMMMSGPFKLSLSSSKSGGSSRFKPSMEEARLFGKRCKPHRILDASQPSGYRLARLGELEDEATGAKAEEYRTLSTPLRGLDAFGIGISLYFRQVTDQSKCMRARLRRRRGMGPRECDHGATRSNQQLFFLSGLFFLCGLVATPALVHNMSFNPPGTDLLARGSAAGATRGDFSMPFTMWIDFAVTVLLVVFAFISRHVGTKVAAKIDESMQTAQVGELGKLM